MNPVSHMSEVTRSESPPKSELFRPFQASFRKHVTDEFAARSRDAFAITIKYRSAKVPSEATERLNICMKRILSLLISSNWKRAAERDDFVFHAFLDCRDSRVTRYRVNDPIPLHGYHHHCVLLVDPYLTPRIEAHLSSPVSKQTDHTQTALDRLRDAASRALADVQPDADRFLLSYDQIPPSLAEAVDIRRLRSLEDVARFTDYATKATDFLSSNAQDHHSYVRYPRPRADQASSSVTIH